MIVYQLSGSSNDHQGNISKACITNVDNTHLVVNNNMHTPHTQFFAIQEYNLESRPGHVTQTTAARHTNMVPRNSVSV